MIHVHMFASYREQFGFSSLDIELPPNRVIADLLKDKRLAGLPNNALFAVNQTFSGRETLIKDGDIIAIMPPVSGG